MVMYKSNRAETNRTGGSPMVLNGQIHRNQQGQIVQSHILETVLPPGNIGSKAGHELHHGGEYLQYGSPVNAPDAYKHSGGVETTSALTAEQTIRAELQQSNYANQLSPAEEANLFDVSGGCVADQSQCPKLEPVVDPGPSTKSRPP